MGGYLRPEETVQQHLDRVRAESQARIDKLYPDELKKYQEKKAAKQARLMARRAARTDQDSLFVTANTRNESLSTAPKLLRSSKADVKTEPQSPPCTSDDSDQDSDRAGSDILPQWQPRKARADRTTNITTLPTKNTPETVAEANTQEDTPMLDAEADEENFIGFGHQISTQEAGVSAPPAEKAGRTDRYPTAKRKAPGPSGADTSKKSKASTGVSSGKPRESTNSVSEQPFQQTHAAQNTSSGSIAATLPGDSVDLGLGTLGKVKSMPEPSLQSLGTFRKAKPTEPPTASNTIATALDRARAPEPKIVEIDHGRPPKWYNEIKNKNNTRGKNSGGADALLATIKAEILKAANGKLTVKEQDNLRRVLHKVQFEPVTGLLLRSHRMLHQESGLPQLFAERLSGSARWPFDIRADAKELYNKWYQQVFETDIMRGIVPGKPALLRGKMVIEAATATRLGDDVRVSGKCYGNNNLLNGQWWPLQIAAVRDGAHCDTMAGISAPSNEPAFSCIMSEGREYKENRDEGDIVQYCGTNGDSKERPYQPSNDTRSLIQNCEQKKPVRLIRSSKVPVERYRPAEGFRYDGLYNVESYKLIDKPDNPRQRHVFRLVRVGGQDPIRACGPEKRPTKEELDAYKNDRKNRGYA